MDRFSADPSPVARFGDQRLAAWCLAALLAAGSALGAMNLFIDGVLHEGVARPVYAATMALLALLGVVLAVRQAVGPRETAALVVIGDVVYVVISLTTTDPLLYAPPLMMLFACVAAAWFLGPRTLALHLVLVVVACAGALSHSYPDVAAYAVQVTVHSVVLDLVTLGIFVLRRRVERLLADTQALSSTDPLTGLANRRWLVAQAPRIWRQARREGQRVAVLMLDLDHFKRLNDDHGHAVGDAVLRGVADALSATVRPADVLARTGGEELVVLGLVSDPTEARQLAERLRQAVASSCPFQPVTASIGVALAGPNPGEDVTDALWRLIDRADAAMYDAKGAGRDQVSVAAGCSRVALRDSAAESA
ncbi:GGDEF domain-containing protein [Modestobacter sp. URMC 112]